MIGVCHGVVNYTFVTSCHCVVSCECGQHMPVCSSSLLGVQSHPQLIGILACAMMLFECMLDVDYCSCAVKDCMKRLWHYIAMGEPRLHFNVEVEAKVL